MLFVVYLKKEKLLRLHKHFFPTGRVSDPDLVFKFLLIGIRIWFSNFSGSGSGFTFHPFTLEQKKSAERALKVIC